MQFWSDAISHSVDHTPRLSHNVKYSSDLTPYHTLWIASGTYNISIMCFFVVKLKFKVILCEKLHIISILVRYWIIWHSDKPYRTSLRLVRYGLSESHLNPYRTRMDAICLSYKHSLDEITHPSFPWWNPNEQKLWCVNSTLWVKVNRVWIEFVTVLPWLPYLLVYKGLYTKWD